MSKIAIITVNPVSTTERLDPDDTEVAGRYAVAMGSGTGEYPVEPRQPVAPGDDPLVEAALDVFHDHIAISELDKFEIDVAVLSDGENGPTDAHWL